MDRREFIKKSGMAAVGSILLATPFASILAKDEKEKKGMNIVVLTGSPRKNGNKTEIIQWGIAGGGHYPSLIRRR